MPTSICTFKPGSDVAMLNAMMNTIITEGLTDEQYIAGYTEGFDELKATIMDFTPEKMEPVCGIPAETLREVARLYARAKASIIFWGMGISQHVHGTDNARCLIALALMTGQVGRPGTGPASAARPEQRAGRLRCRPDPDVLARLSAGRTHRSARAVRKVLASGARSGSRPHGGRDHERDPCRRDHGHVYRGREPGDVGSRPAARARGAGEARASRGAGSVRHRDRVPCRRHPAGVGVCREVRHLHQHRPPRAARARGDQAARRRAAGSVDHPGDRQADGTALELQRPGRCVHRDDAR